MQIVDTKVKFIISEIHICQGYKQAYLVASSKGSYDSAVSWAKGGYYGKSSNTYEEYETDNKDFQLSILESAKYSSQGGKLSFWNCLVKKDDKEFVIGISSQSLCELLKKTTWINGVCQDGISFYRNNQVEVIRTSDIQTTDLTLKKTTKWEIGKTYGTKNTEDICVGEIYTPIVIDIISCDNKCIIDFNKKSKAMFNTGTYSSEVYIVKTYPSRYEMNVPQISINDVHKMVNDVIEDNINWMSKRNDPYLRDKMFFSFDGIPRCLDTLIEYHKRMLEDYRNKLKNKSNLYHSIFVYIIKVVGDDKSVETFTYDNRLEYEIKILEIIIPWLEGLKNE